MSEFTKAEQRRFLRAFGDRFYRRADRTPTHFILEECHEYLPQQVRGENAALVETWQRIVKQGRFKGLGVAPLRLTKSQWGTVSHLKTSGGTWSTYLSDIRRAGARPAPLTPRELQDHYRGILRRGAATMLDALIDAYPDALTRDALGAAAEISTAGGTFSTYLSDLTRNGLARKIDNRIIATEILIHGPQLEQLATRR